MAAKKKPIFDYEKCIACGICVTACPVSSLELQKTDVDRYKKSYPEVAREGCIGCGICAKSCPMDAIIIEEVTPDKEKPIAEKNKKTI